MRNTSHASNGFVEHETELLVSAIRNDSWMVRYYVRNKLYRQQAILRLGLTVREAFNTSKDYEALLAALLDGLAPKDTPPRF